MKKPTLSKRNYDLSVKKWETIIKILERAPNIEYDGSSLYVKEFEEESPLLRAEMYGKCGFCYSFHGKGTDGACSTCPLFHKEHCSNWEDTSRTFWKIDRAMNNGDWIFASGLAEKMLKEIKKYKPKPRKSLKKK